MAGVRWSYRIKTSDVGVADFRRVDVTVAFADQPDRQLVEVSGFLRRARRTSGPVSTAQFAPRRPECRYHRRSNSSELRAASRSSSCWSQ